MVGVTQRVAQFRPRGRRDMFDLTFLFPLFYKINVSVKSDSLPLLTTSPAKAVWEERVALAQLCNKIPIGFNGTPYIYPQNCPFPFDDHHPHLTQPSLDRPHSPRQTASESSQPFCHSTLCGPTERQTDRWDMRQICTNSAYTVLTDLGTR